MTPSTAPAPLATRGKLFHGLADPSRLAILEALREGPRTVSDIVAATGLGQPNVSNHLACLLGCGLVSREPAGRRAFYRLSDPRVDALLSLADELLADVARGVESCPRNPRC
ncbi:MAG TPA: metalloregulator ArsR/SmtB family transcription factor [Longimicrobium sp.]|jgi:DNA-binding transcriptional ArsR family regulator